MGKTEKNGKLEPWSKDQNVEEKEGKGITRGPVRKARRNLLSHGKGNNGLSMSFPKDFYIAQPFVKACGSGISGPMDKT